MYYIIRSAVVYVGFNSEVKCIVAFSVHLITILQYYSLLDVGGGFGLFSAVTLLR